MKIFQWLKKKLKGRNKPKYNPDFHHRDRRNYEDNALDKYYERKSKVDNKKAPDSEST